MPAPVIVLGPQRPTPNLRTHLDRCGVEGSVALVTAGWRHEEDEIGPLVAHVERPVRHLRLYAEMDALMRGLPDLSAAYRARQEQILLYKDVYRISLRAALTAVRDLRRHAARAPSLYEPDLRDAFDALQRIDARLLHRLDTLHAAHADLGEPWLHHPEVAAVRERLLALLEGVGAMLIAGGHVAVLRNRLRFFGLDRELIALPERGIPLVAWSAGAMVLTRQVVLFYDDPPHGHGEAEVLGRGFNLVPGVVLLPHARLRMDLADAERLAIFAGRFAPEPCVGLESGVALERDAVSGAWTDHSDPGAVFHLGRDGELVAGASL